MRPLPADPCPYPCQTPSAPAAAHCGRRLRVVTLGCKVNQYETQYVRQALLEAGFRDAAPGEEADLCIVNTCTVTLEGDYKSRKLIRRLARQNPHAHIVVMGCYAARAPEEVARLPGVVEVWTDKRDLPRRLQRFGVREAPSGIRMFSGLHRAFVKIQDGCVLTCTYCIVPKVRPALWSRPAHEVLDEVRQLLASGYREIVLTGIHLGFYGRHLAAETGSACEGDAGALPVASLARGSGPVAAGPQASTPVSSDGLVGLLRRLVALEGHFRIRLSSLDATEVSDDLLDLMAEHPDRLCPHLHLPLQSGSDAVLRRMRRRGTAEEFIDRCRHIQKRLDQPALTTDVIVGFPGESDADFQATCRAVEAAGLCRVHVFRFSPRPGTPAAQMLHQLPPEVKRRRAECLQTLSRRLAARFAQSLCGRQLEVLVEGRSPHEPQRFVGTAERYVKVEFSADRQPEGLVRVSVDRQASGLLQGRAHLRHVLPSGPDSL